MPIKEELLLYETRHWIIHPPFIPTKCACQGRAVVVVHKQDFKVRNPIPLGYPRFYTMWMILIAIL
jgi:hypothetical protein